MGGVLLPALPAGSVRCWATAVAAGTWWIDPLDTRWGRCPRSHRYVIDTVQGPLTLSVPLAGTARAAGVPLGQVRIASHDRWWQRHWGALYSAYGRSPYFDYVADDLRAALEHSGDRLLDLVEALHALVVDYMRLPVALRRVDGGLPPGVDDLRPALAGKGPDRLPVVDVPYYQMWSPAFTPGLSILDLLMNQGPAGYLTLLKMGNQA